MSSNDPPSQAGKDAKSLHAQTWFELPTVVWTFLHKMFESTKFTSYRNLSNQKVKYF